MSDPPAHDVLSGITRQLDRVTAAVGDDTIPEWIDLDDELAGLADARDTLRLLASTITDGGLAVRVRRVAQQVDQTIMMLVMRTEPCA